jgi:hypothetical protein
VAELPAPTGSDAETAIEPGTDLTRRWSGVVAVMPEPADELAATLRTAYARPGCRARRSAAFLSRPYRVT